MHRKVLAVLERGSGDRVIYDRHCWRGGSAVDTVGAGAGGKGVTVR